jgi:DNA invertase Pin-like site-specific DNA recombinase
VETAKDMRRPGVQEALRPLQAGEANAFVVAKLDRLSRSMIDFTALMATAQKQTWALVAFTRDPMRGSLRGRSARIPDDTRLVGTALVAPCFVH